MYNLKAYAYRKNDVIYITVIGELPNSCYEAQISDKYPSGSIVYVTDPNVAQLFITQNYKPNSEVCTMNLIPWVAHATIIDKVHDEVEVYLNDELKLKIKVEEKPQYIVIALTESLNEGYYGCSVVPENSCFLTIYSKVYGPDSKKRCLKWINKNCKEELL